MRCIRRHEQTRAPTTSRARAAQAAQQLPPERPILTASTRRTEMRGLHQCLARAAAPYTLVRPLRSARAKSGVLAGTRATPTRWLARERCRIHAHSCLDWTLMKPKPSFGLVMYHMVCHVPVPSDSLCPWLQRPRVAFVSPAHTRSRLHFYTIQAPDPTLMNLKVGNRRISIIGARAKERVNTEHLPRASKYFPAYPFFQ